MRFNTIAKITVLLAVPLSLVSASSSLRGGRDLSVSKEVLKQQLELIEAELDEIEDEDFLGTEEEADLAEDNEQVLSEEQIDLIEAKLAEMDEGEDEFEEMEMEKEEFEEMEMEKKFEEEEEDSEDEEEEEEETEDSEEEEEEDESEELEEQEEKEEEEEGELENLEEEDAVDYDGDNYVVEVPDGYDPELGDSAYPDFGHFADDNETPKAPIGAELPVDSSSSSED